MQSYRDVVTRYQTHLRAKSLGLNGLPCGRRTIGLLQRRPVVLGELVHIGKETNRMEEVEAGIEHSPDEVWNEYTDPGRDPWPTLILPILRQMPIERLLAATGLHQRSLFAIRAGERLPHFRNRNQLIAVASRFAKERLRETGLQPPIDDSAACAALLLSAAGPHQGEQPSPSR